MNSIYEIILLLTLLKSIVLVRKFSLSSQNFLFIYLLVTFLVELFSWIILLIDKDSKFSFQYIVYCIFCILFFWLYYSRQFHKKLKKESQFTICYSYNLCFGIPWLFGRKLRFEISYCFTYLLYFIYDVVVLPENSFSIER